MRKVTVAAAQFPCALHSLDRAEFAVRHAAENGANIVLLQELFADVYFCQEQDPKWFRKALPFSGEKDVNPLLYRFSKLAAELGVVLPISFFERSNNSYFNSVAVIDADGTILAPVGGGKARDVVTQNNGTFDVGSAWAGTAGASTAAPMQPGARTYRKSHIPDGPGYQEKFYFSPGDSGFFVWDTRFARIGVGICWDQWFPEAARSMVLQGAELLFYPTAIGSEPQDPLINSRMHWQRVMQGHAAANLVPVIASNRIGWESLQDETDGEAELHKRDGREQGVSASDYERCKASNEKELEDIKELLEHIDIGDKAQRDKLWKDLIVGHHEKKLTVASPSPGMLFYGSSFITDNTGAKVAEADHYNVAHAWASSTLSKMMALDVQIITAEFDLEKLQADRASWGLFRDRRPGLYGTISTLDGKR